MCSTKKSRSNAAETWKPVVGFEGYYEVSDRGRVRSVDRLVNRRGGTKSLRRGRMLKLSSYSNGYLKVSLAKEGKQTYHLVHRLVASAFIPNPNNYPCVNHIDENKKNNKAVNLEWCTHSYNHLYSLASCARCCPCINLTTGKRYVSFTEASRDTGIDKDAIRRSCNRGLSWSRL